MSFIFNNLNLPGDIMGDKSPKSKDKNQKQKDSGKNKAAEKAQAEKEAKSVLGKVKK